MKNFNMGIEISPQKIFTDTSVKFDAAIKLNRDRRLEPAKEIIIALLDGFYSRTQEQKNSTNAWSGGYTFCFSGIARDKKKILKEFSYIKSMIFSNPLLNKMDAKLESFK